MYGFEWNASAVLEIRYILILVDSVFEGEYFSLIYSETWWLFKIDFKFFEITT